MKRLIAIAAAALIPALGGAAAPAPSLLGNLVTAGGKSVGVVRFISVAGGTQITVDAHDMPPGVHGVHVHAGTSCAATTDASGASVTFGAALGHLDPASTGHHLGPDGGGHAGDLPVLNINDAGIGRLSFFANALPLAVVRGHAFVVHANPDNYTDTPPNGGSGGRIACGIIGAS